MKKMCINHPVVTSVIARYADTQTAAKTTAITECKSTATNSEYFDIPSPYLAKSIMIAKNPACIV